MTQAAAIYTRVSSDRQKEEHTIASQTAALLEYAQKHSYVVPPEWVFQDEGYSGATLIRPGLEALRDLAAQGQMVAVLVYSPDRLSRKYAYQVLLAEEFSRCGVNLVFLQSPAGTTPGTTARENAQSQAAIASGKLRITIIGDGKARPSQVPAARGEPGWVSQQTACTCADAGGEGAPADLALARERNPRWL